MAAGVYGLEMDHVLAASSGCSCRATVRIPVQVNMRELGHAWFSSLGLIRVDGFGV